ncbi:SIR2 family protein [Isoptericola sp. NPDC056573]|uniref:SIR2 family protein n=1 Tax=Isoptericola sp. NPDC056573 TaxID=3345868 RepID=UPI003691393E
MRFAEIDLPQELITAHADGDVVFFVGAGVSVPPPTCLPLFGNLTEQVALLVGEQPNEKDVGEPDVYLGRLAADPGLDIHRIVSDLISRRRQRNALHDALATLAATPGPVRMVTTNYDDHLHRALSATRTTHTVFEAPALPLGNDFEGLVHLHGRVGQPPQRLVITDSDFGTAYITRGWAPTFLRDLFSRFVVCFVGYSHEDRMMDYLAKGLPSDARERYIITDRDDPAHWHRRRIVPICYPSGEHDVVIEVLTRWGAWARDTPLNRAQTVRALAADTPPAGPDDHDVLVAALEDETLVAEVCAIATGPEWAEWMAQRRPFKALLRNESSDHVGPRVPAVLAEWIANAAVAPDTSDAVVRYVTEGPGPVAAILVSAVVRRIMRDDVDLDVRSTLLRWALTVLPSQDPELRLVLEAAWTADATLAASDALLVLEQLTSNWNFRNQPFPGTAHRPELMVDDWALKDGIERHLRDLDVDDRRSLLTWLTGFFEYAHRRTGRDGFDPWSFSRSAIAPHEQDEYSADEVSNVLIDVARDQIAAAFDQDGSNAALLRQLWLDSAAPLLRRLALHSLSVSNDMPIDTRVGSILNRPLLFDLEAHHEVYELIAVTAAHLAPETVEILTAAISQGPDDPPRELESPVESEELRDRRVFELLHWLRAHRPDMDVPAELTTVTRRHPDWEPREHPDFTYYGWSWSSTIEDEWPWQPDEFHQMLAEDPGAALARFDEHAPSARRNGWWGAGDMLEKTIAGWPTDGFIVWEHSELPAIRRQVITGWASADMADSRLDQVASLLLADDLEGLESAVARLVRPWSNEPTLRDRWVSRADGRELARRAFASLTVRDERVSVSDLYTSAINSTVGTLAEYWLAVAVHEARRGTFPGGGLYAESTAALSALIDDSAQAGLALAPLLRQLDFLYRADPQWTNERLLQLLTPTKENWSAVEDLWTVVLHGRLSEDLLDAGVRDWVLDCLALVTPDSRIANDLAQVAALITVRSTMDDVARLEWMTRLTRVTPDRVFGSWIRGVARRVGDLEDEARTSVWKRWMRPHIKRRIAAQPKRFTPGEATALLSWVATLPRHEDVGDAARLLLDAKVGLDLAENLPSTRVLDDATIHAAPQEWSRLVAGMLEHTKTVASATGWFIRRIVDTLEASDADREALAAIKEAVFRLGLTG